MDGGFIEYSILLSEMDFMVIRKKPISKLLSILTENQITYK